MYTVLLYIHLLPCYGCLCMLSLTVASRRRRLDCKWPTRLAFEQPAGVICAAVFLHVGATMLSLLGMSSGISQLFAQFSGKVLAAFKQPDFVTHASPCTCHQHPSVKPFCQGRAVVKCLMPSRTSSTACLLEEPAVFNVSRTVDGSLCVG